MEIENSLTLESFNKTAQLRLNNLLTRYITKAELPAPLLQQSIEYAVLNGGKHIRPLLVYLSGRALGATWENLDAAACAIELIHAYSLVHDDLPAMDNADLRRGKPSCHKAFDEATAILAGDALQPLAFEILASHPSTLSSEQRLDMIKTLSYAAGAAGMAGGQALDLAKLDSLEALTAMYRLKTGALLTACIKLGEIAANTGPTSLGQFADCIGLAFQIQDDLLDVESTTETLGKPQGLDQTNAKITYPAVLGIEQSRHKVRELFASALESLTFLGDKGDLLREFAHELLDRRK